MQPQQGPEALTFRYEMRQIYRVAGADLDPSSLQVEPLGQPLASGRRPAAADLPRAARPGHAERRRTCSTATTGSFPGTARSRRRPGDARVVHRLPHLQPFADPTRLTPAERSDSLYRTPLYLLLPQGPPAKFQVRLRYNSTGAGDRSTLSLGALQIREDSEQLCVGGRRLERGVDYTISYDLGQVTFLNPDALFGSAAGPGDGAVRGAGPLCRGPDHDPGPGHPLLAGRSWAPSI